MTTEYLVNVPARLIRRGDMVALDGAEAEAVVKVEHWDGKVILHGASGSSTYDEDELVAKSVMA